MLRRLQRLTVRQKPQVVLPAIEDDYSWHGERVVLVESGLKRLWWIKPGEMWSDLQKDVVPSEGRLVLVDYAKQVLQSKRPVVQWERPLARLTRAGLAASMIVIEHFFRWPGLLDTLDINTTAEIPS
jgi:hypothetical protein